MLNAAARVLSESGYGGMSVARVTGLAGVSRKTFYDQFEDREDCFLALFEDALARASRVAREAVALPGVPVRRGVSGGDGWREQLRAGLAALLGWFTQEPALGSLLVVDALRAGPKVLERRRQTLEVLAGIIDRGRTEVKTGAEPPSLTAEATVGAVLGVIHARMLGGDQRPLIELLNPMMATIVLPYLGRAAAAKELARPLPKNARKGGRTHESSGKTGTHARHGGMPRDPLEGLDMRLTYRTLMVLSAIASLGGQGSGPSNREVADAAGVHDQGQISKLLSRLEGLGLIHNDGNGQPRGEPNSWELTPRGQEVQQSLTTDGG
jgi:AcrR family transcriptional regulator